MDGDRHSLPGCRQHGCAGAATAAGDEPGSLRHFQLAQCLQQPGYISIVADDLSVLTPEGIAGLGRLSQLAAIVHRLGGELLVGNRDIATAAGSRQRSDQEWKVSGVTTERDIDRSQSQRPERGVLHGGRERMRDRVTENDEYA
jgi:hypothetical protein